MRTLPSAMRDQDAFRPLGPAIRKPVVNEVEAERIACLFEFEFDSHEITDDAEESPMTLESFAAAVSRLEAKIMEWNPPKPKLDDMRTECKGHAITLLMQDRRDEIQPILILRAGVDDIDDVHDFDLPQVAKALYKACANTGLSQTSATQQYSLGVVTGCSYPPRC